MNGLRGIWADGRTALGAWISLREPLLAEQAAIAGYDYVCIDTQHGQPDVSDVPVLLSAMGRGSAVPLVRVPKNDHAVIGRVLDAGALGVIVPMINTADDARRAVAACRYAPLGERSFGPQLARVRHGLDYFSVANEAIVCLPMIETVEGVEAIEDIVRVDGVDAVYVGPADLSVTLGLPPSMTNTDEVFVRAIDRVLTACRAHGVVVGIHVGAAQAGAQQAAGFRMLTVAGDIAPAIAALSGNVAQARESMAAASSGQA
jgi:4-hydroxy-2-oxoheptanedioate aldolase